MSTVTATSTSSPFGFTSTKHFFASVFSDLHKALVYTENAATEIASPTVQAEVEGITGVAAAAGVPQASAALLLERAAFSALGLVVSAAKATDAAVSANGLNIALDAADAQAFAQLPAEFAAEFAKLGIKL